MTNCEGHSDIQIYCKTMSHISIVLASDKEQTTWELLHEHDALKDERKLTNHKSVWLPNKFKTQLDKPK